MKSLIKNIQITNVVYDEIKAAFIVEYSFNLHNEKVRTKACIVSRQRNITIGELMEEMKVAAYKSLTLDDVLLYFESKGIDHKKE